MSDLSIGEWEISEIYGPGTRFVIWLQGCSIRCKGCWNTQFWSTDGGSIMNPEELASLVANKSVTGVTILGGEPLDQKEPLLNFVTLVKSMNYDIMLYSGYEEDEIEADPIKLQIVGLCDIVITGRYIEQLRDTALKWRGSSNQQIKYYSDKYKELNIVEEQEIEIILDDIGNIKVLGYPESFILEELS
ncbi:MAG: radical SAM protein [Candidatus Heimdallarchaeota archaeon]|nr:radical SAM protein [Candidatus Heimdallarchaeota archaeon]